MNITDSRIAVIILTLNQRDLTLQCLTSLQAVVAPRHDVLVWDNGSQDGTITAVNSAFPEVLTHYHPRNLGVASGRNAAAKLAVETFAPTHLLFLDNDMVLETGFLMALYDPFTKDKMLGQTQAKLRFMHDRGRLNDGGGANISFLLGKIKPVGFDEVDRGQYDATRKCISCGGAMMVRTDVFCRLSGFDTAFDPFGPEDLDFSLRLQKAGFSALFVPKAVAYHLVNHTFGRGYTEDYARNKLRHWLLFMKRHAAPWQRYFFFIATAPFLALKIVLRELRNGNMAAVKGLVKGMVDALRSRPVQT